MGQAIAIHAPTIFQAIPIRRRLRSFFIRLVWAANPWRLIGISQDQDLKSRLADSLDNIFPSRILIGLAYANGGFGPQF
jgi:hypothetical protein